MASSTPPGSPVTAAQPRELRSQEPHRRDLPLRVLLTVPFLVQLLMAVGLATWLSVSNGQRAVEEVTSNFRESLGRRIEDYLSAYLDTPHRINRLNADALRLGELDLADPEQLGRHFFHQLGEFDDPRFIFVATPEGGAAGAGRRPDGTRIVDRTRLDSQRGLVPGARSEFVTDADGRSGALLRLTAGFDARERPWFAPTVAAGGPVWSPVYPLFEDGSLALAATAPVYDDGGQLTAVTGVDLTLSGISSFLRGLEVGEGGQTFIVERSGLLVASSAPEGVLGPGGEGRRSALESGEASIAEASRKIADQLGGWEAVEEAKHLRFDLEGGRQFLDVFPLGDGRGLDWVVVMAVPEASFLGAITANTRRTLMLCLGALILAALLGWLMARRVERPVQRLIDATDSLADGVLDRRVEVAGIGGGIAEVSRLGRSFNRMAAELERSFDELESRVAERTEELKRARDAANADNQAKTRFLAHISHEIRTPLAAILGYLELLSDRRLSHQEADDFLRIVRDNGAHLEQLLSDLLDVSRIEAGRFEPDVAPVDLADLLNRLISVFEGRAAERGLGLRSVAEGRLPWTFDADARRLRQILSNLLGNALKFTEQGEVCLAVTSDWHPAGAQEPPARAKLRFEVTDTGVGIRDGDRRRLFESFTQVDSSRLRRQQGFGLGLAIVQQLVQMMDGTVEVASQVGRGSTFTVEIPVVGCADWGRRVPVTEAPRRVVGGAQTLAGHVLIADDSRALAELCRRMLERWGLTCETVADGRQAVHRATAARFDVILMDWQMPELDGLGATRELRRLGVTTPILALTAAVFYGDREQCLAAGCDRYMVKPIDFKELYRLLAKVLGYGDRSLTGTYEVAPVSVLAGQGGEASAEDGGDDAAIQALKHRFLDTLPGRLTELRDAARTGNETRLSAIAHRLVGTAGSYGLDTVSEAAARVERAAVGKAAPEDRHAALKALEEAAAGLRTVEGVARDVSATQAPSR